MAHRSKNGANALSIQQFSIYGCCCPYGLTGPCWPCGMALGTQHAEIKELGVCAPSPWQGVPPPPTCIWAARNEESSEAALPSCATCGREWPAGPRRRSSIDFTPIIREAEVPGSGAQHPRCARTPA